MTKLTKALLGGLLAAIAGGSQLVYAVDCAHRNVPSWVHESEAYESCPREELRTHTVRPDQVLRPGVTREERHPADASAKAAIAKLRSPFRDDTAA